MSTTADGVIEQVRRVDWLAGVAAPLVTRLVEASELRALAAGDVVYWSGDPADRCFVLVHGRVGAARPRHAHDGAGHDVVWYFIGDAPLTTLCLENVITGIDFFATMRVLADETLVLEVPQPALETLLAESPTTGLAIARHIARRLQAFTEEAVDLAVLDVNRRLAKYLLRLVDRDGVTVPVTQTELAARLAASRQSINAALTRFVRRGWVEPAGRGRYRVIDRDGMGRFAGRPQPDGVEAFR